MSKDIIIKQVGQPKTLSVDGLMTRGLSNKNKYWLFLNSESATDFVKMTIGRNGTFKAEDFDAQAITEVNVTNSITDVVVEPVEVAEEKKDHYTVINEGGNSYVIGNVKKLRVNKQDGGTIDLVPKTEISTGTLNATQLGKYIASEDGYTGYSIVNVNIDHKDGLPDEIRVITPPTKIEYEDGEPIDYTGIVVQAYKNGEIWENDNYPSGIIPFNELILSDEIWKASELIGDRKIKDAKEIKIEASGIEWEYGRYNDTIKDFAVVAAGNEYGSAKIYDRKNLNSRFCILWEDTLRTSREMQVVSPYMISCAGILTAKYTSEQLSALDFIIGGGESPISTGLGRMYIWYGSFMSGSAYPGGYSGYWQQTNINLPARNYRDFPRADKDESNYTYNNKTAYYQYNQSDIVCGFFGDKYIAEGPVPLPNPNIAYEADVPVMGYYPAYNNLYSVEELGKYAWTMLYGETNIMVQWARPLDNVILSAFFKITIV